MEIKKGFRQRGVFLVPFLFFIPILFAALYKDDLVLTVVWLHEGLEGTIAACIDDIRGWLSNGRFFPITSTLYTTIFRIAKPDNYLGYHIVQYILLTCNAFLLLHIIKRWNISAGKTALLSVVLLYLGISLIDPNYHDPYVAFQWQIPLFFIFFIFSITLFEDHLESGRALPLVSSLFLYALCILTYEIAYPLLLVYAIQILYRKKGVWRYWIGLALVFVVLVLFQLFIRGQAEDKGYAGVVAQFSLMPVIKTFTHQIFSSLPLSWFWGKSVRFIIERFPFLAAPFYILFFLLIVGFSLFYFVRTLKKRDNILYLSFLGLLIWLLPALPIAISAKYQGELNLLRAYLPRYLQNMGFIIFTLPLLIRWSGKRILLIGLSALTLTTFSLNIMNIREANQRYNGFLLLYRTLEDKEILDEWGVETLHMEKNYTYERSYLKEINANLQYEDTSNLPKGEHLFLIHENVPKETWAYLGRIADEGLEEIRLISLDKQNGIVVKDTLDFLSYEEARKDAK